MSATDKTTEPETDAQALEEADLEDLEELDLDAEGRQRALADRSPLMNRRQMLARTGALGSALALGGAGSGTAAAQEGDKEEGEIYFSYPSIDRARQNVGAAADATIGTFRDGATWLFIKYGEWNPAIRAEDITGGDSGSPDPQLVKGRIYTRALSIHDDRRRWTEERSTHIDEKYPMAMSKAKIAAGETHVNGGDLATAKTNVESAVNETMAALQESALSWQTSDASDLADSYQTIIDNQPEDGTLSMGDVYAVRRADGTVEDMTGTSRTTETATLADGREMKVMHVYASTANTSGDGVRVTSYGVGTVESDSDELGAIIAKQPDVYDPSNYDIDSDELEYIESGDTATILDAEKTKTEVTDWFEKARTSAIDEGKGVADDIYNNYAQGELDLTELLSPEERLRMAISDYTETSDSLYRLAIASELGYTTASAGGRQHVDYTPYVTADRGEEFFNVSIEDTYNYESGSTQGWPTDIDTRGDYAVIADDGGNYSSPRVYNLADDTETFVGGQDGFERAAIDPLNDLAVWSPAESLDQTGVYYAYFTEDSPSMQSLPFTSSVSSDVSVYDEEMIIHTDSDGITIYDIGEGTEVYNDPNVSYPSGRFSSSMGYARPRIYDGMAWYFDGSELVGLDYAGNTEVFRTSVNEDATQYLSGLSYDPELDRIYPYLKPESGDPALYEIDASTGEILGTYSPNLGALSTNNTDNAIVEGERRFVYQQSFENDSGNYEQYFAVYDLESDSVAHRVELPELQAGSMTADFNEKHGRLIASDGETGAIHTVNLDMHLGPAPIATDSDGNPDFSNATTETLEGNIYLADDPNEEGSPLGDKIAVGDVYLSPNDLTGYPNESRELNGWARMLIHNEDGTVDEQTLEGRFEITDLKNADGESVDSDSTQNSEFSTRNTDDLIGQRDDTQKMRQEYDAETDDPGGGGGSSGGGMSLTGYIVAIAAGSAGLAWLFNRDGNGGA